MNVNSKTPNFDQALDEILSNLLPHQKTCLQCGSIFDIFQEDIEFYRKLKVPPPKLCPDCRKQRRFGFYNNILKFYKKDCSAHQGEKAKSRTELCSSTGVISTFPPESPYKIFDLKHWWSDKWGGEDFARDYDFNKPFFEQFQKLNLLVPHPAIVHYWKGVINSPYTISIINAKNCYFTAVSGYLENVHYSHWAGTSKDCLDLLNSSECENSYELVGSGGCYNCKFCQDCMSCIDSAFLYDCKNCQNCFGCSNLKHKSYCFFNKQLTKEEYNKRIQEINLGNRDTINEYIKKFEALIKKSIRRNLYNGRKNINSFGDNIWEAKNCYQVFRGVWVMENLRYCVDVVNSKDSMELWIVGPHVNLCYELIEAYDCSNIKFSYFIKDGLDLEYCLECHNCQNCFGCVGLRNKKYHIFNKPYSENDYWKKLDEIKTKMLKDGEYGEFFPLSMALHPYNNTYASVEFPLSEKEARQNGWDWYDDESEADTGNLEVIEAKDLPKDIKDIDDNILNKAIICEASKKPFRIIKAELDFYRKNNLPIPAKHPYQRLLERFQKRNPSKIWKSSCVKCNNDMYTSYPPEKQKELKIYCEACYLKEVV
ncbi:MAG: hypothetical protein V3T98_00720 [Candidatus Paceibacterota bacterium]